MTHNVYNNVVRKCVGLSLGSDLKEPRNPNVLPLSLTSFLTGSNGSYLGSSQVTAGSQKPDYMGKASQTGTKYLIKIYDQ